MFRLFVGVTITPIGSLGKNFFREVMVSNNATCDSSLLSTDFQIAAKAFAEKWKKFNSDFPEWLWIDCSNRLGFATHGVSDGYLSVQNVFFKVQSSLKA
ncbi:hypothetical protein HanPSC8_Chr03g0121311 [Helianthus annuus]|nr:hypothetical protein HanPSC8_Chr03g0121311 [Helianthus annuus]